MEQEKKESKESGKYCAAVKSASPGIVDDGWATVCGHLLRQVSVRYVWCGECFIFLRFGSHKRDSVVDKICQAVGCQHMRIFRLAENAIYLKDEKAIE